MLTTMEIKRPQWPRLSTALLEPAALSSLESSAWLSIDGLIRRPLCGSRDGTGNVGTSFCYQFPEPIQTPLRSAGRAVGIKSTRGSHEYEGPLPDKGRRISGSGSDW